MKIKNQSLDFARDIKTKIKNLISHLSFVVCHSLKERANSKPDYAKASTGKQLTANSKSVRTAFIVVLFFIFSVFPASFGDIGTIKTARADDTLDQLNSQLNELNQKINEINGQLAAKRQEKKTLQNEIAIFDAQIYQIELQIQATEAEIARIQKEIEITLVRIKEAEDELLRQKEILKENLRILYEEGQISAIEVVASSDNFSEFMNRTEYLKSIQDKISETIDKINQLKAELEAKKKELETKKTEQVTLLNQQQSQKSALSSQKYARGLLLQETQGLESLYQKQLGDLYSQRAALSRRLQEGSSGGGTGGYPYTNNCGSIDPWSFYACQCTSYVAWRSSAAGPVSGEILKKWGSSETANGGDWGRLGRKYGFRVDSIPTSGSIMVFSYSGTLPYGHVAMVDSVNGNGTVNVSEFNYEFPERFGTRTNVNPLNYGAEFIH